MDSDGKGEAGFLIAQGVVQGVAGGVLAYDGERCERAWEQALGGALLGGGAMALIAGVIKLYRLGKAKQEAQRDNG